MCTRTWGKDTEARAKPKGKRGTGKMAHRQTHRDKGSGGYRDKGTEGRVPG